MSGKSMPLAPQAWHWRRDTLHPSPNVWDINQQICRQSELMQSDVETKCPSQGYTHSMQIISWKGLAGMIPHITLLIGMNLSVSPRREETFASENLPLYLLKVNWFPVSKGTSLCILVELTAWKNLLKALNFVYAGKPKQS